MIQSKYIKDIVENLLDSSDVPDKIKSQIYEIQDKEYEYTGAGLFVTFFCTKTDDKSNENQNNNQDQIYDGLKIESPELEIGATATLFIKSGLINSLEIWSHSGNYPRREIKYYILKKEWKEKTMNRTKIEY